MKNIHDSANLIQPISPKEYSACLTWYNRSCFLIVCLIVSLATYTTYHYWNLSILKKKYLKQQMKSDDLQYDTRPFDEQIDLLQQKMAVLQKLQAKKNCYNQNLKTLLMVIPSDICLDSFEYANNKFIEIVGRGRSLSAITNFLKSIQNVPALEHLVVTKLQPTLDSTHREYVHFTMH